MRHAPARRRHIFTGWITGTISTGDGQGGFPIPWGDCYLTGFGFSLDVGGSSSGSTDLMLNRVRDETDAELLTGTLDIEHDATTVYSETETTFQNNQLQRGDIVRVDVDAIPTSPAGLAWWVEVHIVSKES